MKLFLCSLLLTGFLALICCIPPANAEPRMPTLQAAAYSAKFQIIVKDTGSTYMAYGSENYDSTQSKSSLAFTKDGFTNMFILDYQAKTVSLLNMSADTSEVYDCDIVSMDTAIQIKSAKDIFHYFGGLSKSSGTVPHMFSTKDIFSLDQNFHYGGDVTIDGIQAEYWTANVTWTNDNDVFQLTYYFSRSDWTASGSLKNTLLPLRIEMQGTKTLPTGAKKQLHHYYEYIDFDPQSYLPVDVFEIPSGVDCEILNVKSKPTPKLPSTLSYDIETVDLKGIVRVEKVKYNKQLGYLGRFTPSKVVEYDFENGVRYELPTGSFKCTVRAIDADIDSNAKEVNNFVQDAGPIEISMLNKKFVYDGQSHKHLIKSNVFGGTVDSDPFSAYFAAPDWKFSPYFSQPPIALEMDKVYYNFFNFKQSARIPTISTRLFCGHKAKSVTIAFYNQAYASKDQMLSDNFVQQIQLAIAKVAKLSVSQILISPKASVYDRNKRTLYLVASFLDSPAPRFNYRQVINYKVQKSDSVQTQTANVNSRDKNTAINQAAGMCESKYLSGNFRCRSFDLCANGDGSYSVKLYQAFPTGGNVGLAQSSSCDHFPRSVDTSPSVPLSQAFQNLKDDINRHGSLQVSAFVNGNNRWQSKRRVTIIATGINVYSRNGYENDITRPYLNFRYSKGGLDTKQLIESVTTRDDCAQKCLEIGAYECQSIQLCPKTKSCYVSSSVPSKSVTSQKSCYVFSRNYISNFKTMRGKTMPYTSQRLIKSPNMNTANDCARQCVQSSDSCESFDFCSDSKECLLSSKHTYDATADQIQNSTAKCTHYSKNYLLDFKASKKTAISSTGNLETVTVDSAEHCAYLCESGYDGAGCVQFDFCADSKVCQIVSGSSYNSNSHMASATCDTYTLKDANRVISSGKLSAQAVTYSDGAFGGLAFAMILLGLVLGAVLFYVLYRQRILNRIIG